MRGLKKELTWEDIHLTWTVVCERFDSDITDGANFLEVGHEAHPADGLIYSVDWWPQREVEDRLRPRRPADYSGGWDTNAGKRHTAWLLREAGGHPERQAAVFILASLLNKRKDLPVSWRGDAYKLIREVEAVVYRQFPVDRWHHATRKALPVSLTGFTNSERMFYPSDVTDLIFITALEAVITHANWQLIEYVEGPAQGLELDQ